MNLIPSQIIRTFVFPMQHPNIQRLHILCLSDGEDSASDNQAATAAQHLLRFNVVLDSVMIGYRNGELKALSVLSGWCCTFSIALSLPDQPLRVSSSPTPTTTRVHPHLYSVAGGHAFAPETYHDAVKIFETEPLIDLGARVEPEWPFPLAAVKSSIVTRSVIACCAVQIAVSISAHAVTHPDPPHAELVRMMRGTLMG